MLYLDYLIGEDDTFVASLVEENCWKMEKMLVEEESRGVQRLNRGVESLFKDIGYEQKDAMKLYCDNKSSIEIANNHVQHDCTKHVEINRHFIKEKIEDDIIVFPFVKLEQQLGDMLTKAVTFKAFSNSLDKLEMCDIHAPT